MGIDNTKKTRRLVDLFLIMGLSVMIGFKATAIVKTVSTHNIKTFLLNVEDEDYLAASTMLSTGDNAQVIEGVKDIMANPEGVSWSLITTEFVLPPSVITTGSIESTKGPCELNVTSNIMGNITAFQIVCEWG